MTVTENQMALCHPERKYIARGLCTRCYQVWRKEKPSDLQLLVETFKQLKVIAINTRHELRKAKIKKQRSGESWRFKTLLSRYGLTKEAHAELLAKQNGVCAICKIGGQLYVDHNHTTGKVRGLLCPKCNTAVGYVETTAHLGEIIAYAVTDGELE